MNADPLPESAEPIFVEWRTKEGGLGVIAYTDLERDAFLGLYPLSGLGRPAGMPLWMRRSRLMTDVVVGFQHDLPLIAFINVEVNARGLSLIVFVPCRKAQSYERHTFAYWGSAGPCYGYLDFPANSNWPLDAVPVPPASRD